MHAETITSVQDRRTGVDWSTGAANGGQRWSRALPPVVLMLPTFLGPMRMLVTEDGDEGDLGGTVVYRRGEN